jgi:hypothetical protein
VQEDRQAIQTKHAKAWQQHRRIDRRIVSRRYFTESYKTITAFCHHHRRIVSHRYFIESCKKITAPTTITDGFPNDITDGWCTFQAVRLLDCLVNQHVLQRNHRRTRKIQCMHDPTHNYRWICRRASKNLEGFSKFWCENQLNTDRHYQQNLMPLPKKNIIPIFVGNSVGKIIV